MAFLKYPNKKIMWKALATEVGIGIVASWSMVRERHALYRSSFSTYLGYLLLTLVVLATIGILIRNIDLITGKR